MFTFIVIIVVIVLVVVVLLLVVVAYVAVAVVEILQLQLLLLILLLPINDNNNIIIIWLVGASVAASMCRVPSLSKDEKQHFISSVENSSGCTSTLLCQHEHIRSSFLFSLKYCYQLSG